MIALPMVAQPKKARWKTHWPDSIHAYGGRQRGAQHTSIGNRLMQCAAAYAELRVSSRLDFSVSMHEVKSEPFR
mgnify:CR=1 FL=1